MAKKKDRETHFRVTNLSALKKRTQELFHKGKIDRDYLSDVVDIILYLQFVDHKRTVRIGISKCSDAEIRKHITGRAFSGKPRKGP
jgi:hypothetical protein